MISIDQVEADIRRCEAYLSQELTPLKRSDPSDLRGARTDSSLRWARTGSATSSLQATRPSQAREALESLEKPKGGDSEELLQHRDDAFATWYGRPVADGVDPLVLHDRRRRPQSAGDRARAQGPRPPETESNKPLHPRRTELRRPSSAPHERPLPTSRINLLAQPRDRTSYERERVARERKAFAQCSFRPSIRSTPLTALRSAHNVSERLFHEADDRMRMREMAKRKVEEDEVQRCGFTPHTNPRNSTKAQNDTPPLHERISDLTAQRHQKLEKIRQERDAAEGASFKPIVSKHSNTLAKMIGGDPADRLNGAHANIMRRRIELKEDQERREAEENTFAPKLSANTLRLIEQRKRLEVNGNRRPTCRREEKPPEPPTFKPHVSNVSSILNSIGQALDKETPEERIERLAFRDKERREQMKKQLCEEYYSQFAHQPKLTDATRSIGRRSSMTALIRNEQSQKEKEQLMKNAEAEFQKQHPFAPRRQRRPPSPSTTILTSDPSRFEVNIRDIDSLLPRYDFYRVQKERKLEEMRRSKEFDDLKECTFHPRLRKHISPKSQGPVVIRGLGRYLELQEKAHKDKQLLEEHSKKVFLEDVATDDKKPELTVHQPFALMTESMKHDVRAEQLRESLRKREQAECTFKPKMQGMSSRELLRRILDDETEFY